MKNTRAKGMRNERRAALLLMQTGYKVFRLYQTRGTEQGELDMIAIGHGRVRFVQVRSNQWHDLRPLKVFAALYCQGTLMPTAEVWLYKDREAEPTQRILE